MLEPQERRPPTHHLGAILLWALIFILYLLLSGCQQEQQEPTATAEQQTATTESSGEDLFLSHCASCHGEGGRGGAMTPAMSTMDFKFGSSKEAIMATIREGKPQAMPAFGQLGDHQISVLADYVLSLLEQGT